MNSWIRLIVVVVVVITLFASVVYLLAKKLRSILKSNRLLVTTVLVVIVSVVGTYLVALFFKRYEIIEQVGSADAWIGFAGTGMGGFITMLALYYTLKQNQELDQNNRSIILKPYVSCSIMNLDEEKHKILLYDYIENYDFIKCKMKNISGNIANGIKIVDEYSLMETDKDVYQRFDDLLDAYGISIYTVPINEGTFLAPQEEYNWKTNISIELDEDGEYKWHDVDFAFKHIVVFEFMDVENLQLYNHVFEYEININVDTEHKLHFFLLNIGNSTKTVEKRLTK